MSAPASTRAVNLAQMLAQAAQRHPDAPALIQGAQVWTWAMLDARAAAFAAALRARGVRPGDRLLVVSANSPQMVAAMFGCWRAGAVWAPANFRQTPAEVAALARGVGARALLTGAGFDGHIAACAGDMGLTLGLDAAEFDALTAPHAGDTTPAAPVLRDDPCWLFFTSGTTGQPKAAVLTHGQMGFVVTNHLCDLMPGTGADWAADCGGADASLVVAPLSHGAGVHLLTQVARAIPSVLTQGAGLDPAQVWALVERHRISNLFTVPTIIKLLVEHPAVDAHDHSSLRHVIYAGAPMYLADQRRALAKLGPVLVQYYGLGEVTGAITVLPAARHGADLRPGTCGFARTGMQVQIQRPDGTPCDPLETGEVCVAGPAVCAGYFDNPAANAAAFRDGWFRTGDLGHMDGQGYLFLTGRASEMFISGGTNIHPREIEEKLLMHPAIAEAAVLGVPDPVWGEVGLAICVPRAPVTAAELLDWLARDLARYKLPRHVVFWDQMPKSAYGKIVKRQLRAELDLRGQLPG